MKKQEQTLNIANQTLNLCRLTKTNKMKINKFSFENGLIPVTPDNSVIDIINTMDSMQKMEIQPKYKNYLPILSETPLSEEAMEETEPTQIAVIFQNILDRVVLLNFHEILELSKGATISKDSYRVATIESFVSVSNSIKHPFEMVSGDLSIYNGIYWETMNDESLRSFLGEVALKLGVPKHYAKLDRFKQGLHSQLYEEVLNYKDASISGININLANKVLSIRDTYFEFNDFSPNYRLTYRLPYCYDENAECIMFKSFLDMVVPDKSVQDVLAEVIASAFLPNENLEKFPVLLGSGGNGKGVFFNIIQALLGKENISNFSISSLTKEDSKERIKLSRTLLNYDSDMSGTINNEYFKKMVSLEPVTARALYRNPVTLHKYARIMGNTNALPSNLTLDDANIRRLMPIPFNVSISEKQKDPDLANKIIEKELPAILNWVLEGLMRLLKQKHFSQSDAIDKALEVYLQSRNPIKAFLHSNGYKSCTVNPMSLADLHKHFITYCKQNQFIIKTDKELASILRKLGYRDTMRDGRTYFFIGHS